MTEKWLLNFSSAAPGGALKRLIETAAWFDERSGAAFIVSEKALSNVSHLNKKNRYFPVKQTKFRRLFRDGAYLPQILKEVGDPDVYFSYNLPLFGRIGKVNWVHFSNALTLTFSRHHMPLIRFLAVRILGYRLCKSTRFASTVSCESEFSLGLLRKRVAGIAKNAHLRILGNGCNEDVLKDSLQQTNPGSLPLRRYALTIGTAGYKRIGEVFRAFQRLNEMSGAENLETLKIIGNQRGIPRAIAEHPRVECLGAGVPDSEFYPLIANAACYISASEIENSSVAVLESMALAEKCLLSDIPSHREACAGLDIVNLHEHGIDYLLVDCAAHRDKIAIPTWADIVGDMYNSAHAK